MNLLKKWGWFFLMVMPGVVVAQTTDEKKDKKSIEEGKLREIFNFLPLSNRVAPWIDDSWHQKDSLKTTIINNGYLIGAKQDSKMSVCTNDIDLDNFIFKSAIELNATQFKGTVSLINNLFENGFDIDSCEFQNFFHIKDNKFQKPVRFNEVSTRDESNPNMVDRWIVSDFGKVAVTSLFFKNNELKSLKFSRCNFVGVSLVGNKIDEDLYFKDCAFFNINLHSNKIKNIIFKNSVLLDTIKLIDLLPSESRVSLINCHAHNAKFISIDLTGCDLNNVDMDYQNFRLKFDSSTKPEEKRQVYLNLLENFKKKSQMDSYEVLDLEYKKQFDSPIKHWLQTFWWNYGYDKNKIFRNTGIFILLFTILTMLFYKKLQSAYAINNANTNYGRFINSFIYTNIVFWALKIDVKEMKFRDHLAAASYIMLVYLTGIICLAYMVNYVIQS